MIRCRIAERRRKAGTQETRHRRSDVGDQGVNPMRGFVGSGSGGDGFRICMSSCRTPTIAASCTSNLAVSFVSSAASFRASSGAARSVSRILTKARMTKTLTRSLPIARPFPKRTMQSIQRRPRTSYSSERRANCEEHLLLVMRRVQ